MSDYIIKVPADDPIAKWPKSKRDALASVFGATCEVEDDQPITAEWLKEQGWVQDDKGVYNPVHQDIEWRSKCRKLIIESESRTIGLNGVRTRSDLLTLIRLIEGCEQ